MLLAIDIGNTNIVFGLTEMPAQASKTEAPPQFSHCWRLGTSTHRTQDEYGLLIQSLMHNSGLKRERITGVAICCVVPALQNLFGDLSEKLFHTDAVVIAPGVKTGMPILYDNPKEVGADRIVNAIAAYQRFKSPCIVVDFGTATTFDFVDSRGNYAGGAIAPGITISAEALFQKAAKLPRVEILKPERVIGKNTVGSIQSGLYYGGLGLVDRMVDEMIAEAGLQSTAVKVISTGGLAPLLSAGSKRISEVLPHLTLEGLTLVYYMNRNQK